MNVDSGFTQAHIGEMEFRAIVQALELVAARRPRMATISSDSKEAIAIARALTEENPGRSSESAARKCAGSLRQRFLKAWRVVRVETEVTMDHVRGHTGDRLNEAADAIASAARRATMLPRDESERALTRRIDDVIAVAADDSE